VPPFNRPLRRHQPAKAYRGISAFSAEADMAGLVACSTRTTRFSFIRFEWS
jgi:hypothetical protein